MQIGADYYPEHWDRQEWEPQIKLMKEGGFNIVRLAEFAWHKMEPQEGRYDFAWLDEAVSLLRRYDIKVILGTPTAAPPPWIAARYPDTLPVDRGGLRAQPGARRHYCFTSTRYRDFSRKIVTAMAQHYTDNPGVVGWQTDNEIGGPQCFCDACATAFRDWLKERYGTVESLNQAWGSVFWGQIYNDFSEIPIPRHHLAGQSPSLRLDHARFHSCQVVSYHGLQVEILRRHCPRHYVTHNLMGFYNQVDYYELAKSLDLVAWDNYPGNKWGSGPSMGAAADYMRSLKHKPFMVMEQRSGLTGWVDIFQSGDQPGQLRLWTYQTVAHGADAVVYFRWRTCRFGTEQYWHGILDHHGEPGRRYQELSRVAKEFAALGDKVEGARYDAPVGILIDPDSRWALEIQKGSPGLDFISHAGEYHKGFTFHHAGVEYYHPDDDLAAARVLVAPTLFLADDAIAVRLGEYVRNGGTLVLTFRSGVKTKTNVVVNDRLPGALKHLTGAVVEEYDSLAAGETQAVDTLSPLPGRSCRVGVWCDQLRLKGAKALARYREGPFKGSPAASIAKVDKGQVIYVGFQGDPVFYRALAGWLLRQAKALPGVPPSDTVEVTLRTKGSDRFYFVLNHSAARQKISLPGRSRYRDLLTGQKMGRVIALGPYDVRILSPVKG